MTWQLSKIKSGFFTNAFSEMCRWLKSWLFNFTLDSQQPNYLYRSSFSIIYYLSTVTSFHSKALLFFKVQQKNRIKPKGSHLLPSQPPAVTSPELQVQYEPLPVLGTVSGFGPMWINIVSHRHAHRRFGMMAWSFFFVVVFFIFKNVFG